MSTAFCLNQHYYVNNGKLHLTISTTIKTECIADIITVNNIMVKTTEHRIDCSISDAFSYTY